jgi:tetratricopeptide (TPR) repeat protein
MQTKTIKLESARQRALLIFLGLLCLLFVVFAAKWFLANSMSTRVFQQEVAQFAVTLAPNDPQTHFASGLIYEQSPELADAEKSLAEYEKAVALSPNNYLLWLSYGKAKERNGDSEGAEKALLKALELAPNYAEVQWVYGNILLRRDKRDEAFAAISKAVQGNSRFAGPAATTAWSTFDGDVDEIKKAIGNSLPVQSALSTFLAGQKRFDEALGIWNNLPVKERKTTFLKDSETIINLLIAGKKYRSAVQMKSQIADAEDKQLAVGKVTNGGFEELLARDKPELFEWQIANGNQPKIGSNLEHKNSGEKSLMLIFNSPVGKDFRVVSQTIAVEGGRNYTFEAFYKSDLETSATVKWEIVDTIDNKILATTDATQKKSGWKSVSVGFTVAEDSEAIIIRLVREKCISSDCSISGTLWLDDISLK